VICSDADAGVDEVQSEADAAEVNDVASAVFDFVDAVMLRPRRRPGSIR